MKNTLIVILICLSSGLIAQNASFGIGASAVNLKNTSGLYFTGNVRAQFTNMLGWQTEVGYASFDGTFTTIEEREVQNFNTITTTTFIEEEAFNSMTLKTALTVKFFEKGGLRGEAIIGGGLYKENSDKFYGLLSGELFLSAQIGKNLVAGIPFSYNFITWERDEFYVAGVSLRFHM